MTFCRKLAHLIPSVRRASERDMQDEVESLRAMAGPGALGNLTLAVEDARSELTWISLVQGGTRVAGPRQRAARRARPARPLFEIARRRYHADAAPDPS